MTITSTFTELFGLDHPIALAPMATVSGGELAGAVSEAGGLGLVGGGYGDADWLRQQLRLVTEHTDRCWGVGLITWSARRDIVDLALSHRPAVVMLSFGDPEPYATAIKDAGARLICQVTDVDEALRAAAVGADVIVAQGTEAGGHGGRLSTLPLVPAVADTVAPTPVLAAGGIADGRGLAAAFMLGAQGALIGTRFYATPEALGHAQVTQRLAEARGDLTERTRVFDAARGLAWPPAYTGRALRNSFLERWRGRADTLRDDLIERQAFTDATARGDLDTRAVFAGEALDLIASVEPAAELVARIGTDAADLLRARHDLVHNRITRDRPDAAMTPIDRPGPAGARRASSSPSGDCTDDRRNPHRP